jgi:hypothetical protein
MKKRKQKQTETLEQGNRRERKKDGESRYRLALLLKASK